MSRAFRIGMLVSALVAAALLAPAAQRAAAAVDISGSWNITLLHPDAGGPIACSASISQPGTALSASMTCTGLGSGNLSGSINTTTGAFTLSGPIDGYQMNMSGTAAGDGNSMSGTFTLPPIPSNGTFSGFRKSGPVGGISLDPQVGALPLETRRSSGPSSGLVASFAGAAAALVLGGIAWHRRSRREL